MMATCDLKQIRFRVARGSGRAPTGLVCYASFFRRDGVLPAPWRNGFLVGLVADNGTGALSIEVAPDGEAARAVELSPGIVYLAVMQPTSTGFRTVRAHLLDVRPVIGDYAAAERTITQEWQALGGGDTPLLFWDIVEPSTRSQIMGTALARGIRVRTLTPAGEQQIVGPASDCRWDQSQPTPPVVPGGPPAPPPLEQPASRSWTKTAFMVGGVLALAVAGVWAVKS